MRFLSRFRTNEFGLALLLCVCGAGVAPSFAAEKAPSSDRAFEVMIAPATEASPRNSEGDIVVLKDGSLLAAWTEFYGGGRDDSAARISARKSSDGGRTWGEPFTLRKNTGAQNVMSVSFLRLASGELLLFYLEKHSRADLDCVVVRSSDEGETWSEPTLVTGDEGYYVMNNARVVQHSSGRLICPTSWTREVWVKGSVFKNVCFYSDDLGKTWKRGADEVTAPKRGAMEPGLIEKKDGTLLQIIRTQTGKIWIAESKDRGDTWSESRPWTVDSPESPATIEPMPNGEGWLLVHNPKTDPNHHHFGARTPLVATVSRDAGKSWSPPVSIETDPKLTYAYTSIDFHQGRVLLTYYVSTANRKISWKFKSLPMSVFASGN